RASIKPTKLWERKNLREIEILPAVSTVVAKVVPNSPAAVAGLQMGDRIVEVNGVKLYNYAAMADFVEGHPNEPLRLNVERKGKCSEITLTPEKPISPPDEKPRLGVVWDANGKTTLAYPGAIEQVVASVNAMIDTFSALFAKHTDIKMQHLGGAVKIMDVYYRLFNSEQGWRLAIWFSVLMNVNLALLNMLPIPVLDGGHILLALVEGIGRRPISMRILNWIQTGCAVVIILYMLHVTFFDAQDLSFRRQRRPEFKFVTSPPDASNPKQ